MPNASSLQFPAASFLLVALLWSSGPAAARQTDLAMRSQVASRAMKEGRFDEAARIYRELVAALPKDARLQLNLGMALTMGGRTSDAVVPFQRATALDPRLPAAWYALGHAYNAIAQEAMATFDERPEHEPWRQLLLADAMLADGRLTDAFAAYRETAPALPGMVGIHDSVARIYELTKHRDWAARERAKGTLPPAACAKRKALCEFRAGTFQRALQTASAAGDAESRYWRVRAATELARAAFKRLDALPDSRERREVRATMAINERRYADAVSELKVALEFSPGDPALLDDLGTAYYSARDYEQAVATLSPLQRADPNNPRLLTLIGDAQLQLQRTDEAVATLRRAVDVDPSDPTPRLVLGRAYVQQGNFAAAIPLLEPQLAQDRDGSIHVQLARAYNGVGRKDKAEALLVRSQELQRAAQARTGAAQAITPPK